MEKLTAEQRKLYLEQKGSVCPFCLSTAISSGGEDNRDADYITVPVSCEVCDEEWLDYYQLTNVLNADGSTAQPEEEEEE